MRSYLYANANTHEMLMQCSWNAHACMQLGWALVQDAANATLRSETLRETMCDAIIANGGVRGPSKMSKTFVMTDASNTVQILVASAMQGIRFSSINCLQ